MGEARCGLPVEYDLDVAIGREAQGERDSDRCRANIPVRLFVRFTIRECAACFHEGRLHRDLVARKRLVRANRQIGRWRRLRSSAQLIQRDDCVGLSAVVEVEIAHAGERVAG